MKVLFVKPWVTNFNWNRTHMVGLVYLASFLRAKGHDVSILDASFQALKPEELQQKLRSSDAQVVGITSMTHEIPKVRSIVQWIKEFQQGIQIVLGGPHASARPVETLKEINGLDFIISGEGELPLAELLEQLENQKRLSLEKIQGLGYRKDGKILYNGFQSHVLNLKKIPQPAVDLYYKPGMFVNHPTHFYPLTIYRGCPFKCAFCSKALGRKVRSRSPEAVVEEWSRAVHQYGARNISVIDEIFLYDNETVNTILNYLIKEGIHEKATFRAAVHVNIVKRKILRKAKEAGCNFISIGVESGNNTILKNIHRPYTIEQAHQAIKMIQEEGIRVHSFFIIGHPGESHKTVFDTIRAAIKINSFEIGLGNMVPYPGTQIYDMAQKGEGGYRLTNEDWDAYDRYGGTALRFDNLKQWQIIAYQCIGYFLFYVLNGRIKDMMIYFLPRLKTLRQLFINRISSFSRR